MTSQQPDINHSMANMAVNDKPEGRQFTAVNSYLVTPPQNDRHSFSQEDSTPALKQWQTTLAPIQPQTPPISPMLPSIEVATGYGATNDAPLFPETHTDRPRSRTPPPLFHAGSTTTTEQAGTQSEPSGEEATSIKPAEPVELPPLGLWGRVWDLQSIREYTWSRVGELKSYQEARRLPRPRKSRSPDRDQYSESQLRRFSKPTGVTKTRAQPKPVSKAKAPAATSPAIQQSPAPKRQSRTPKARTNTDFLNDAWPTAQPTKHKRAPPSKKVEDSHVNWKDIQDVTPSTSTLDDVPNGLKVNWHGNPMNLGDDPDREYLHPQELKVASTLRLSCAAYLSNKRKIFLARLQSIKDGKNFTKTAAQGACSIDVNKASQLWEAFDRVGWFKERNFQQHL